MVRLALLVLLSYVLITDSFGAHSDYEESRQSDMLHPSSLGAEHPAQERSIKLEDAQSIPFDQQAHPDYKPANNLLNFSNDNSNYHTDKQQIETNNGTELVVSNESQPPYMQAVTILLVTLHLSVFITGLIGNSLVILSVYRNKSLQTVTNYYIVNLAVADFLVILICLPPTVYWDLTQTWNFGLILCKLVPYLQSISVSVSVLTLTCISIDRWYAICRPLNFSSSKRRAKIIIGFIWTASMLIASPDVLFLTTLAQYEEENMVYIDCTYSWQENHTKIYQLCIVALLFVGPFVLMSISYMHIVNVLWRNETMVDSMEQSFQLYEEQQTRRNMDQVSAPVLIVTSPASNSVEAHLKQKLEQQPLMYQQLKQLKQSKQSKEQRSTQVVVVSATRPSNSSSNLHGIGSTSGTDGRCSLATTNEPFALPNPSNYRNDPPVVGHPNLLSESTNSVNGQALNGTTVQTELNSDPQTHSLELFHEDIAQLWSQGKSCPPLTLAFPNSSIDRPSNCFTNECKQSDHVIINELLSVSDYGQSINDYALRVAIRKQSTSKLAASEVSDPIAIKSLQTRETPEATLVSANELKTCVLKADLRFGSSLLSQTENDGPAFGTAGSASESRASNASEDESEGLKENNEKLLDDYEGKGVVSSNVFEREDAIQTMLAESGSGKSKDEAALAISGLGLRNNGSSGVSQGSTWPTSTQNEILSISQGIPSLKSELKEVKRRFWKCLMPSRGLATNKDDFLGSSKTSKRYRKNLANYAAKQGSSSSRAQITQMVIETGRNSSKNTVVKSGDNCHQSRASLDETSVLRKVKRTGIVDAEGYSKQEPNGAIGSTFGPNIDEAIPSLISKHQQNRARFYKLIESRKKAAKMLIVIMIMFGICYLPVHFLNILRYTIGLPQNDITTIASLVSHWMCYFNSAINPLIYNLMSGKFRHEFANLFKCRCFG